MAVRGRIKTVRPDSTAPSITLTSPASGTTVSSAFSLTYDATDDRRVERVATLRSGTTIASYELSAAPWTVSVCTLELLNSDYDFRGQAFDTKGNSTFSNAITIHVSNPSPVVAINSHSNWDVVSATTTLTVSAANTNSVRWYVNGTIIGAPLSTAPYKLSLTTSAYADGPVSVYALAENINGGSTESDHIFMEVLNTGSVSFNQITVMRSNTSGSHWVSPFGIPAASGDVVNNRKYKLVARYPNSAAGTLYPIQVDNEITSSATGDLKHAAGHVKLPSTYVSGTNVGIGHSGTYTFPTSVDWTSVTGNFTTTFTATLSEYQPKLGLFWINGNPAIGDSLDIVLTDGTGSQSYSQDITSTDFGEATNVRAMMAHCMSRRITGDPSGRFKTVENAPHKFSVMPSNNDPRLIFQINESASWMPHSIGDVVDQNGFAETNCRMTTNQSTDRSFGMCTLGGVFSKGWAAHPYFNLNPESGGNGGGFPIMPRYRSGNPENWSATFQVNRTGRSLAFDTVTSVLYGRYVLNYDNGTAAFNNTSYQQVIGRTSGARGWIAKVTGTTSGKLVFRYVTGTFVDNEIMDAYIGGVATPASGSAQVNGPIAQNKLRGATSGAIADLLDTSTYQSSPAYIRNVTGTFQVGETITDDAGGSARCAGTISAASTWTVCIGQGDSVGATSGTIPTLDTPVNRTTLTATWNSGTDIPNLSAYFNGHQVYQKIRNVPFMNGATPNAHLNARMVVTWDNTGAIIDRQVTVENSTVRAYSKAYWYDVTSISNGVTNYIASTLDNYKQLYHHFWTKWRWRQDKAFGMSDPVKFMKAKLTPSWTRYPTRTSDAVYKKNTQGLDSWLDHSQVFARKIYDARGGYSKDSPNMPLYAGPIKFDALGGAAPEIAVVTTWEQYFLVNDSFGLWTQFEALCDNCWSAFPWYMKDDAATAISGSDWADATPHPYLRWYWNNAGSTQLLNTGDPEPRYMYFSQVSPAGGNYSSGYKIYSMWSSETTPPDSHAPPHPARVAYLVRPEECFHASVEQYGRVHVASNAGNAGKSPPKNGGTAGDADHVIGHNAGNGNRSLSWPWRSATMAASLMFDRHPRRTIWRRTVQDFANHFTLNVERTWGGFYEIRQTIDSNNWRDIVSMRAGEPFTQGGINITQPGYPFESEPAGAVYGYLDHFKSSYVTNVAVMAHELELVDLAATLDLQTGWAKISNDMTDGKWWWMFSLNHFPPGPFRFPPRVTHGSGIEMDPTALMWPTENMMDVRNGIQAMQDAASSTVSHSSGLSPANCAVIYRNSVPTTVTPGQVDMLATTSTGSYGAWGGPANYVMPTFYATALRGLARTMATASNRALAQQVVDLIDATIPGTQRDLINLSSWQGAEDPNPISTHAYYYDWLWGTWATRQPSQVTSDWE